ncbi:MAG: bacteriohopanetetrol glucosamine biosynthesis glycosyltransferase HpnI [Acetobacteraceae bacterium]|nr:bacteriohopanetetrol glucosamine biosynthesis glycosyltransferase HpnI [Acetobacteraceae bacterium]
MGSAAWISGAIGLAGLVQSTAGFAMVRRFVAQPTPAPGYRPPVTILKPLYGHEPLLEQALATACSQNYPEYQIVFGVTRSWDPALAVVHRLQTRFPHADIAVVVNADQHGQNRKVSNLMNMLQAAKHDVIVIADSDIHALPDYLDRLVAALEQPRVGLVTTLYTGWPVSARVVPQLGAAQINYGFLPSVLFGRALGRQDCLGATMALNRATLGRMGGFEALVPHLADDNVLGRKVRELGLHVQLASAVPSTTVPEETIGALFRHELRWARTIRRLAPAGFAASALQYSLGWAALAAALAGSAWGLVLFGGVWAVRSALARGIDTALRRQGSAPVGLRAPIWLLPLRDLLSLIVMASSYFGRHVEWRGHDLIADSGRPLSPATLGLEEAVNPR